MSNLEIPESWAKCKVGDVLELRNGYAFKSSEFNKKGIKVVRISNIQDGSVDLTDAVCIPPISDFDRFSVKFGDLLIAMSGATTGKMGVYTLGELSYQNQRVGNLKIKNENAVDANFRNHFFRLIQNDILKEAYGGAQPNISGSMIEEFQFGLPPVGEQKRIVAKVESTQAKIKNIEQSVTKAEELIGKYREALLQKAFRGELVPQDPNDESASKLLERIRSDRAKQTDGKKKKKDDLPPIKPEEIPFEIPKSWEWVRMGSVSDSCLGKMLDGAKNKGVPSRYLGNINVRWFKFDLNALKEMRIEKEERDRFSVVQGDLIVCEGGEPGRAAVWDSDESVYFQKALHRVRPIFGINSQFLAHWLFNQAKNGRLDYYFTGMGIKHLVGDKLRQVVLPLPPIEEQLLIVNALRQGEKAIEDIAVQLKTLKMAADGCRSAILRTAFSGGLVPQDLAEGTGHELLERIKLHSADADSRAVNMPKAKPMKRAKV